MGFALAFAIATASALPAQAQQENTVILLDSSGSMSQPGASDGTSKWDIALQGVRDLVNAPHPDREFELWTFNGVDYVQHFSFADGSTMTMAQRQMAVINAVDALPGPTDLTPMAMSICDAVDTLIAHEPGVFPIPTKRIAMWSDGLENSTPDTHPCWGPSSGTDYDPTIQPRGGLETDSWQWKVLNKAITGDPQSTASLPPDFQIITDVQTLFEFIPTLSMAGFDAHEYAAAAPVAREQGTFGTAFSTMSPGALSFMEALATETGGRFQAVDPQLPPPVAGDITGDRCVDFHDYQQVIQFYGQSVSSPESDEADLNRDGMVDYLDYTIVIQNWGSGANC